MPDTPGFDDFPIHVESRLRIRSVCRSCGASRVVSVLDGSLETWKEQHVCEKKGPAHAEPPAKRIALNGLGE